MSSVQHGQCGWELMEVSMSFTLSWMEQCCSCPRKKKNCLWATSCICPGTCLKSAIAAIRYAEICFQMARLEAKHFTKSCSDDSIPLEVNCAGRSLGGESIPPRPSTCWREKRNTYWHGPQISQHVESELATMGAC